jgi:hypothetical protein
MAPSESILDNRLFIRLDFDHSLKSNSLFLTTPQNRGLLGSQLLLYDSIVIPTLDFGIIPILINWFGLKTFEAILESSTLKYIRRNGMLGYAGNGVGLNTFTIQPGPNNKFEWWEEAIFGENSSKSIDLQLINQCSFINKTHRDNLLTKIMQCTDSFLYDNQTFMKNIVNESYRDILENTDLSKYVAEKENYRNRINLQKLASVAPNQMRVLGQNGEIKDAADLVLRVSEINMEVLLATSAGNIDILTSEGSEKVLANKLKRFQVNESLLESFSNLIELNNIPDIGSAITNNVIDLNSIWILRSKKNSTNFRKWLRDINPNNSRDLEKAYIAILGRESFSSSLPIKTIRLALTTLAGLIPPLGLAVSAVDCFFVDKWLNGYSPKLFFDDLSKLPFKN